MSEEIVVEEEQAARYRFCPICAGEVIWVNSLQLVPQLSGFECQECFFFEFT